ncbi:MAG: hypothetical protein QM813_26350 [Verrucomicrobiota bacterium]
MKLFLQIAILIFACQSPAANVRNYFVNPFTGATDTNALTITRISTNVLSSGGVIGAGIPQRVPFSPYTNSLSVGFYSVSNMALRSAYVINVDDSSATLYDCTNLLHSGFNLYVTRRAANSNEIVQALGFVPGTGSGGMDTNAAVTVAQQQMAAGSNVVNAASVTSASASISAVSSVTVSASGGISGPATGLTAIPAGQLTGTVAKERLPSSIDSNTTGNAATASALPAGASIGATSGNNLTNLARDMVILQHRDNTRLEYGTNLLAAVQAATNSDTVFVEGTVNLGTSNAFLRVGVNLIGRGGRILSSCFGPAIIPSTNNIIRDLVVESDYLPLQQILVDIGGDSVNQGIGTFGGALPDYTGYSAALSWSNVVVERCVFWSQADCVAFGTNRIVRSKFTDCVFNYYWDGYVDDTQSNVTNDLTFVQSTFVWQPSMYTNDSGYTLGGAGQALRAPAAGTRLVDCSFISIGAPVSGMFDGGLLDVINCTAKNIPTSTPFTFDPAGFNRGSVSVDGTNWIKDTQVFLGSVSNLNTIYSITAAGTAATLTDGGGALDFGTTDPVLYITNAGTYRVDCGVTTKRSVGSTLDELGTGMSISMLVQYASGQTVSPIPGSLAAGWANGSDASGFTFGETPAGASIVVPSFILTTTTNNAVIRVFGQLSEATSSGTITATAATLTAVKLNP